MNDKVVVRIRHLRKVKMCSGAAPRLFCRRHGFDWRDFLENGIPAEKLIATGDAMAMQAVEAAKNGE